MDCSPPGSSIHGILQARVLEWGAITFSASWPTSAQILSTSPSYSLATTPYCRFFKIADYFACCIHRTSYKWNHSFSMKACFHSTSCFVNTSKITSFQTHISPGTPSYQNHGYKAFFSSQWNTAGPWRWRWASLQVTSNYHKLLKKKMYWSGVASQCCVSVYRTAKGISYMYTYIPSFLDFFPT